MQNLPYLFAAYALVWLVLFAYLFVVAAQVRTVQRDVDQLKERVGLTDPTTERGGGSQG
jgi:CcmD family protein